jgi:hypothetical protein
MNRMKLTPLGRLLIFVLILTIGAIAGAAGAAATKPHAQAWRCIAVRPGDTLWTLAGRNPAADRRETVHRIVEHNLVGNETLAAGSSVWIPNEGDFTGLVETDPGTCSAPR